MVHSMHSIQYKQFKRGSTKRGSTKGGSPVNRVYASCPVSAALNAELIANDGATKSGFTYDKSTETAYDSTETAYDNTQPAYDSTETALKQVLFAINLQSRRCRAPCPTKDTALHCSLRQQQLRQARPQALRRIHT